LDKVEQDIVDIKLDMQQLIGLQRQSTENINKLSKDLRDTVCASSRCTQLEKSYDEFKKRIETLESNTVYGCNALKVAKAQHKGSETVLSDLQKDMDELKSIPNKLLWRFALGVVGVLSAAFTYNYIIPK
jgi:septation ring formation regulator EzrA